jgi:hypothetical protein
MVLHLNDLNTFDGVDEVTRFIVDSPFDGQDGMGRGMSPWFLRTSDSYRILVQ